MSLLVSTGDSEVDENGLVIIKYPALQKPKPTTWCAMGDSITAGTGAGGSSYSYANVCANLAGVTAIYNYGIAGSCLCAGYNTLLTEPGVETAFCNRYTEMSDSGDLITILGSVNDHRADVKIGSPTSTDKNDFYGALYVLITGLKQKYPNGRIVFITPFKIGGWDGTNMYKHSLQDFRNAIVTQCNRFQIEVVDLFSEEQFSWLKGLYQNWFYSYDYYHPTPQGHQAIAQWLQGQLFGDGSGSGSGSGTTTTYGNIIVDKTSYTMNENSNTTVNVSLDKAPTNDQTVYITTDGNVSTSKSSLIFTPTNYNVAQSFTLYSGYAGSGIVTLTSSNVNKVQISVTINSSSSGGSGSGLANSSDTALTQQYSSSHEATPNNSNPPSGAYNWKYAPRINPDGLFPNSTWNAFGHWVTSYKVEGASLYDNVGLLLQDPKAWIWNTSSNSWDILSSDFEWGSWYLEDFYDDGNSTIANSVTWENGVSGNHSTWVKIKQDSTTNGRCFHPWGYQKNWRSNSAWSNNGQPYIVTKVDFKLVKYDENGVDNLDSAQLVVNSGGDWWSYVGATWQPDWSTNRDMAVGKYILATRELKRAWCTNLPNSWSYGLPTDGTSNNDSSSSGGSSSGESGSSSIVSPSSATIAVGETATFTVNNGSTISNYYFANGKCSIWSSGSTTITIKAQAEGQDYLNLVLSDGNTVSISIVVGSSSGGSSGGGSSSTIDGLVAINNVASKQSTSGEWIAFGDSITYGFGVGGNDSAYPARVASASSLRANNYGESGRSVAIGASGATVPDERSFCNYYTSLPSSCAMITVFGGVNDFLLGVPLGSSSSTDKSTFYGALNVLADGIKSRYSSSRIVFFTPIRIGGHGSANSQGLTLKDYRNAIVTVCNNKGIEVLDLYSLDSMDADVSVSNYMGTWDTTHPNGNGHQAIADYILSQMLY